MRREGKPQPQNHLEEEGEGEHEHERLINVWSFSCASHFVTLVAHVTRDIDHEHGDAIEAATSHNKRRRHINLFLPKSSVCALLTREESDIDDNDARFISTRTQNGLLPDGFERREGLSLELRKVQRQHAGVYTCAASNGVGRAAEAHIEVNVKCEL